MRVITPGKIPEPKEYYFRCSYCKCEFMALETEVQYIWKKKIDQRDGEYNARYISCPCPTCNKIVEKQP